MVEDKSIDEAQTVRTCVERLEQAALTLDSLIRSDAALEQIESALAERGASFESLRCAGPQRASLSVGERRAIARILEIDRAAIDWAGARADALKTERVALTRTKSAMTAHGLRERDEPKLVAVKA